MELDSMKEEYQQRKTLLNNVLNSPKPSYSDVQALMQDLWVKEQRIIMKSGTIYNGL